MWIRCSSLSFCRNNHFQSDGIRRCWLGDVIRLLKQKPHEMELVVSLQSPFHRTLLSFPGWKVLSMDKIAGPYQIMNWSRASLALNLWNTVFLLFISHSIYAIFFTTPNWIQWFYWGNKIVETTNKNLSLQGLCFSCHKVLNFLFWKYLQAHHFSLYHMARWKYQIVFAAVTWIVVHNTLLLYRAV